MLLIKNCKICDPYSIYEDQQDILIENGTIKEIAPDIAVNDGECSEVIDASGLVAAPGFAVINRRNNPKVKIPSVWQYVKYSLLSYILIDSH